MRRARIYPIWFIPAIISSLILLVPFAFLIMEGMQGESEHWSHITDFLLNDYILNSFSILISVATLTLVWGVIPAYLVSRFSFPMSRTFTWLLTAPLAIPTFIMAIVYSGVFDITGPVAKFSMLLGFEKPFYLDLMNFWGLSFTLSFALFPYVFLSALIAFKSRTRIFDDTGYSLGLSPVSVFFRISLRMALPFILTGVLLVMMELLNDYGAMKYYGYNTFTTGIFKAWFDLGDLNAAIKLSGFLFMFVVVLLWIKRFGKSTQTRFEGESLKKKLSSIYSLLACGFCFLIVLFSLIIPAGFIVINGINQFSNVIDDTFISTIAQSMAVGLVASFFVVLFSIKFSYSVRIHQFNWLRRLFGLNNIGYAIPGAIIAIGVIALGQIVNIHSGLIFGSLLLLIMGYIIRFFSSGYQSVYNALAAQEKELDETGKLMGLNVNLIFARIHFSQIKPALLIAFLFVFIEVLKELPMTLILKPFNFETLATSAFQYATDEMLLYSCVPAMFILILTLIPSYFIHRNISQ